MRPIRVAAIIPARMGSTRFPGKPLVKIHGLSMIEHVRRRVAMAKGLEEVLVATCDFEIKKEVERFGGKVVMTSPKHERATDRVEEACKDIDVDIVVNVQGDEPMIHPGAIESVVSPFRTQSGIICTSLIYRISQFSDLSNLNVVKAVLSKSNRVLYFSRAHIPGRDFNCDVSYYKQSGIMAFTKEFLPQFQSTKMTPLEIQESVDLMRIIENDLPVHAVVSSEETIGVDVPDQVQEVEEAMVSNAERRAVLESVLKVGI